MPARSGAVPAPVTGRMYTRSEFLTALEERGYPRTPRWHEDMIERGLLDQAARIAAADPARRYVWPERQLELATSILVQVGKGAHLASLANCVVWIWLWWGDAWVPFCQVPRSLIPWRAAEQAPAEKHVRKAARETVRKIAHPQGVGKLRLAKAFVEMTYRPDADPEQLREPFEDLFDPDRTGAERGPEGARLSTDRYVAMVALRMRALRDVETFTEDEYRRARALYLQSRREYALEQPRYAADPSLGRMFEVPDDDDVINSACHDLVACLGIIRERVPQPNRAQRRAAR